MFEPASDLSTDLEYMLQSNQANNESLVEALLLEYFSPVYRLALSILNKPELAWNSTIAVFSSALLNLHHFRSEMGVHTWLFRFAVKINKGQRGGFRRSILPPTGRPAGPQEAGVLLEPSGLVEPDDELSRKLWPTIDDLNQKDRLIIFFRFVLGWSDAQIARVLPESKASVHARSNNSRHKLRWALFWAGLSFHQVEEDKLDKLLSRSLQMRWPAPVLTLSDLSKAKDEVLQRVDRMSALRRRSVTLREIFQVGMVILLVFGVFWGYNWLFPEQVPTEVVQVVPTSTRRPRVTYPPTPTWPLPRSTAMTSTPFPKNVFYYVNPGDTIKSIADQLGVSVDALLTLNRLPPGGILSSGQALLIPGRIPTSTPIHFSPVTPRPLPTPLNESSSPEVIIKRIQESGTYGSPFWFDLHVALYGPQAYIGLPQIYRLQAWISDDQILALAGYQEKDPNVVIMGIGEGGLYIARAGGYEQWFTMLSEAQTPEDYRDLIALSMIFRYGTSLSSNPFSNSEAETSYKVMGSDKVAGRDALILEEAVSITKQRNRLWVDKQSGFILKRQQFAPGPGRKLLLETLVTGVAYNVEFPKGLIDPRLPWRGSYAKDYTGQPFTADLQPTPWIQATPELRLFPRLAPANFNAGQSSLIFQSPYPFNLFDPQLYNTKTYLDLFVDGLLLSHVEFPDPLFTYCTRSPDGQRIAYSAQAFSSEGSFIGWQPLNLRWIDLSNPSVVHTSPGEIQAYDFAFAPDSRRLAFFGSENPTGQRGIFILDTTSGSTQRIDVIDSAGSLVWSPDGEYLAWIIPNPYYSSGEQIIVARANDGEVIYRSELILKNKSLPTGTPAPAWLSKAWGKKFPAEMGGVDACANPPNP